MAKVKRIGKVCAVKCLPDKYVVVDIETTGLDPQSNEIIEISALKYEQNVLIDSYHTLVHPNESISTFITGLTGITDEMVLAGKEAGFSPYARILGFRKSKAGVLSEIKKHTRIPLVAKTADASRMLSGTAKMLFEQDLYASHVRQSLLLGKTGQPVRNEFTQPICII